MLATAMLVSGMGIDMGSGKGMMLRTLMLASDMGKDSGHPIDFQQEHGIRGCLVDL